MHAILALTLLLPTLITASRFNVVRSRPLTPKDLNPRTGCPRDLPANSFSPPSLIVPISQKNPDKAFGPSRDGIFTPNDMSSIFNFDVPASRSGQNCTLEFIFPQPAQVAASGFSFVGNGTFFFTGYNPGSGATVDTTYNQQPQPGPYPPFPPIHMVPGNAYTIDVGPCIAGTVVSGLTSSNDTTLIYYQDSTACPIGVYVAYS